MPNVLRSADKIDLLKQYSQLCYWEKTVPENIRDILQILQDTDRFFDLEFCLFYKEGLLQNTFKFAVASSHFDLISVLSLTATWLHWVAPKRWRHLQAVQFIFTPSGDLSRIGFLLVRKDSDAWTIHTQMINYSESDVWWTSSVRSFNHQFWSNYMGFQSTVCTFKGLWCIDMYLCRKPFFWGIQTTIYLLFSRRERLNQMLADGERLGIIIPKTFLERNMYIGCICLERWALIKWDLSEISVYLVTYWS